MRARTRLASGAALVETDDIGDWLDPSEAVTG
jgi:hypothetical protein